jgi:hypothetical protein
LEAEHVGGIRCAAIAHGKRIEAPAKRRCPFLEGDLRLMWAKARATCPRLPTLPMFSSLR